MFHNLSLSWRYGMALSLFLLKTTTSLFDHFANPTASTPYDLITVQTLDVTVAMVCNGTCSHETLPQCLGLSLQPICKLNQAILMSEYLYSSGLGIHEHRLFVNGPVACVSTYLTIVDSTVQFDIKFSKL